VFSSRYRLEEIEGNRIKVMFMRKTKGIVLLVIMFGLFISIQQVNVVSAKPTRDLIKIGALGPLDILTGKDMQKGAELAVAEINAGNGVDVGGTAHDFDLTVKSNSGSDGLSDTAKTLTALDELTVSTDVSAIIGGFRTEAMWAIQANLNTTETPFLGVGSTAPLVSEYYWRVGPSNGSLLATSLIEFYAYGLANLGVRNVTIVRENLAWTGPLSALIHFFLAKFLPLAPPPSNSTPLTFTSDITVAEGAGLDAVKSSLATVDPDVDAIIPLFSAPSEISNAWFANNMTQFLAGINVDAQKSTYFDETEGAAYGEMTLEPMPPDIDNTAKTAQFRTDFAEANSGELPTYTAAFAYDAVYILKEAIEGAGAFTKAAIQTALSDIDYTGAVWKYKFTTEPGPQFIVTGVNDTLGPNFGDYLVTTVPGFSSVSYGSINVHDLYTTSTVGVRDPDYGRSFIIQWQQNGTKKTVWGKSTSPTPDVPMLFADLEWPINHDEHGWAPTPAPTPGLELPLILLVLANMAVMVRKRRRKKT
jgi:branched-chain amino acid transport system substrate-binding protein